MDFSARGPKTYRQEESKFYSSVRLLDSLERDRQKLATIEAPRYRDPLPTLRMSHPSF